MSAEEMSREDPTTLVSDLQLQLAESKRCQEILSEVISNVSDLIVITDSLGKVMYASSALHSFFGFSQEATLENSNIDQLLGPEFSEAVKSAEFIETGSVEMKLTDQYGMIHIGLLKAKKSSVPVQGTIFTIKDITAQKRAEDARTARERLLERIYDILPVGLWIADKNGHLIPTNAKGRQIWGAEPLVGREEYGVFKAKRFPTGEEIGPNDWALVRTIETGETIKDELLEIEALDGTRRIILNYSSPVFDKNGNIEAAVVANLDVSDEIRAELYLRDAMAKYKSLFDNAPVGILSFDTKGKILEVNQKLLEILGSPSMESTKQINVLEFPPLLQSGFADLLKTCLESGQPQSAELPYTTKWGKSLFLRVVGTAILDRNGTVTGCQAVVEDVTDKKAAESKLEKEYRINTALAELYVPLMSQPTTIKDIAEAVLDKAKNLTGSTHGFVSEIDPKTGENIGHTLTAMMKDGCEVEINPRLGFPRNDDGSYPKLYGHSLNTCEPFYTNSPSEHPAFGGTPEGHIPIDRFLSVPVTIGNALVGQISLANPDRDYEQTDIELIDRLSHYYALALQRKRWERVLKRLATAIEQSVETVVITDASGEIEYVNSAFEKYSGQSRDQLIGRKAKILEGGFHDIDQKEMFEVLDRGEVWIGQRVEKRADGSTYEEDVTVAPVLDQSGERVAFVIVKKDVSKERALQRQLFQAQKMEAIGILAGGIAHDFNNLLQVIVGYSELLMANKTSSDPEHSDIQKIHSAALSGSELVRSLLTFSRKVEPNLVPVDITHHVRNIKKILGRTISKLIEIRIKEADSPARVNADPTQIDQILMNLAVNARDAMPNGGILTLETRNVRLERHTNGLGENVIPGNYIMFSVSDTGHGIDDDAQNHIYEPFYTTKELGRGTGLGLATVYGIVEQHGGYITCSSEVGNGTTFRIYLPAIPDSPEPIREAVQGQDKTGTQTVLVVDDEELVRSLAVRILTKQGYRVLEATDGKEAVQVYAANASEIDLVILDLIMPVMGGYECLKSMLAINPDAKILMASGYSGDIGIRECFELGAKGYINKPFTIAELLNHVHTFFTDGP